MVMTFKIYSLSRFLKYAVSYCIAQFLVLIIDNQNLILLTKTWNPSLTFRHRHLPAPWPSSIKSCYLCSTFSTEVRLKGRSACRGNRTVIFLWLAYSIWCLMGLSMLSQRDFFRLNGILFCICGTYSWSTQSLMGISAVSVFWLLWLMLLWRLQSRYFCNIYLTSFVYGWGKLLDYYSNSASSHLTKMAVLIATPVSVWSFIFSTSSWKLIFQLLWQ